MEVNSTEDVYITIKKADEWRTLSCSLSASRVDQRINYFFTCKRIIIERYQDQDLPDIVREQQPQIIENVVQVDTFDTETTYVTIERELSGWDLSHYFRKRLIKDVICKARDMLKYVSPGHNGFGVSIEVVIVQNCTFSNLSDAINNLTIQQSIEEIETSIVPARDSSIEYSLRRYLMASDIDGTNCVETARY